MDRNRRRRDERSFVSALVSRVSSSSGLMMTAAGLPCTVTITRRRSFSSCEMIPLRLLRTSESGAILSMLHRKKGVLWSNIVIVQYIVQMSTELSVAMGWRVHSTSQDTSCGELRRGRWTGSILRARPPYGALRSVNVPGPRACAP